jgi:hypothetical protein
MTTKDLPLGLVCSNQQSPNQPEVAEKSQRFAGANLQGIESLSGIRNSVPLDAVPVLKTTTTTTSTYAVLDWYVAPEGG